MSPLKMLPFLIEALKRLYLIKSCQRLTKMIYDSIMGDYTANLSPTVKGVSVHFGGCHTDLSIQEYVMLMLSPTFYELLMFR